jgi:hypothetical protein
MVAVQLEMPKPLLPAGHSINAFVLTRLQLYSFEVIRTLMTPNPFPLNQIMNKVDKKLNHVPLIFAGARAASLALSLSVAPYQLIFHRSYNETYSSHCKWPYFQSRCSLQALPNYCASQFITNFPLFFVQIQMVKNSKPFGRVTASNPHTVRAQ